MISVAIVGHGLAGRSIHAPLVRRQSRMRLRGLVVRDPGARAEAVALWGGDVIGYASLEEVLVDPAVDLVVLATPHDTHAEMTVRTMAAGKACVVEKVMALSAAEADRMIGARDRSGRMLSVFHNRRWDWDFLTVRSVIDSGRVGVPRLIESSVCRYAPSRAWRGRAAEAGTILHDWGAHLVDQALSLGLGPCRRVSAWIAPAPWPGVDTGGHGRIFLEFDGAGFLAETGRLCTLDRPRWWVVGSEGGLVKYGLDPQELALRAGDLDGATEPPGDAARLRSVREGAVSEKVVPTVRGSWDAYYDNIADHLLDGAPLAVTAEQAREVVRVLDAATESARDGRTIAGPFGG
jgi:scyllo-inositol 2-dehydrogenase (NADP+)